MKELIAKASSDWHLHYWEQYNKSGDRVKATIDAIESLFKEARAAAVPILFGGDLFHTPEGLKSPTINAVYPELVRIFHQYNDVTFYAISGNHDQYTKNFLHAPSVSYVAGLANTLQNFVSIDNEGFEINHKLGIYVYGIPYLYLNKDMGEAIERAQLYFKKVQAKKSILIIHTTLNGSVDTNGYQLTESSVLKEELENRFDLVLSGHIHKHQKMGKGLYHIGSATHVKTSDAGYVPVFLNISTKGKGFIIRPKAFEGVKVFKYYRDEHSEEPDTMWVKEPSVSDTSEVNSEYKEHMDYKTMMLSYLQSLNVKSPRRRNLSLKILKEITDVDSTR